MVRKDTRYDRSKSDEMYNARRRFARAAQRYMKQAANAIGETKARFESLAREAVQNAVNTYGKGTNRSEWSKPIRDLADKLKAVFTQDKKQKDLYSAKAVSTAKGSESYLEKNRRDDAQRRAVEAEALLSGDVGHRIYAGTIDIWKDVLVRGADGKITHASRAAINRAIMDYFGVNDMMSVIELFEESGIDLYSKPEQQVKYDEVMTAIQETVSNAR